VGTEAAKKKGPRQRGTVQPREKSSKASERKKRGRKQKEPEGLIEKNGFRVKRSG